MHEYTIETNFCAIKHRILSVKCHCRTFIHCVFIEPHASPIELNEDCTTAVSGELCLFIPMPNIKILGNGTEAAWFNLPFTEIPPKWTTEFKICTLCFWNKGFFVKTLWNYSGRDIYYLNIPIWLKHVSELQKNEVQKSVWYFKRCVYVLGISGTQICTKPVS